MYAIDWNDFTATDVAVLCFVRDNGSVLLIHKKRGLGAGKINGPGGKLEEGETPVDAAIRETTEEVGVVPENPVHRGVLRFAFTDGYNLEVHVFVADRHDGEPIETQEAKPFWQSTDSIPFDKMWADDRLWLPQVLEGRTVNGRLVFRDDEMIEWNISVDGTGQAPFVIAGGV